MHLGGDYHEFATMDDLSQLLPIDARARLKRMEPFFTIEPPDIFKGVNIESTLENPLPLGYGQLFNCQVNQEKNYPDHFETIVGSDEYFAGLWETKLRKFVPKITTLHLGPRMVHWDGRKILE